MSELREHLFVPYSELQKGDELTDAITIAKSYYLKSEADTEIEFWKKESHDHYERWFRLNKQYEGWFGKVRRCEQAERELFHHKYKRCLDKAAWCGSEEKRLEAIAPLFGTDKECWEYNSDYWAKWRSRWLEIAEKFKESNK